MKKINNKQETAEMKEITEAECVGIQYDKSEYIGGVSLSRQCPGYMEGLRQSGMRVKENSGQMTAIKSAKIKIEVESQQGSRFLIDLDYRYFECKLNRERLSKKLIENIRKTMPEFIEIEKIETGNWQITKRDLESWIERIQSEQKHQKKGRKEVRKK